MRRPARCSAKTVAVGAGGFGSLVVWARGLQGERVWALEDCRHVSGYRRALTAALKTGEPAGQIAARELEIGRIQSALRRADELTADVAQAIEAAA